MLDYVNSMEITVSIPQAEQIDFDRTCYALIVKSISGMHVSEVGLSVDEVKTKAINRPKSIKYKRYMDSYIDKADLGVSSLNKFHQDRSFEVAECDMKLYLYFKKSKYKYDRFIFEKSVSPFKLKYSRNKHGRK